MDWAKAKTILIIALIITDIFLVFNYASSNRGSGEIDNTDALVTVLRESNINVKEIPLEHSDMPTLTVRNELPDENEVSALIENAEITVSKKIADEKEEKKIEAAYIESAEDFIQYLGMMSEYLEVSEVSYDADAPGSGEAYVEFRCGRNGYEIDGSYMRCTFKDGILSEFKSHWLEPVEFSKKKLSTISASVALITYMTEREDEIPVNIEKIEMVYWVDKDSFDSETVIADTALPTWRFTLDNGGTVHIDAIEK